MAGCDPFTNKQLIELLNYFKGRESLRNKALLIFGCATGFRISEILSIRRRDVLNIDGSLNAKVTVIHTKNKHSRSVILNPLVKPFLMSWLQKQELRGFQRGSVYLFSDSTGKCLSRKYVWRIIKQASSKCRFSGRYGTHSMRKTFAKNTYEYYHKQLVAGKTVDPLIKTKEALGHMNINSTQVYLTFMAGNSDEAVMGIYHDLIKKLEQNPQTSTF